MGKLIEMVANKTIWQKFREILTYININKSQQCVKLNAYMNF